MARCSFYNDSKSQLTSDLSDEARAMTRVPVIYNFFEEYLFLLNYIIIDARVIWERSVRELRQKNFLITICAMLVLDLLRRSVKFIWSDLQLMILCIYVIFRIILNFNIVMVSLTKCLCFNLCYGLV